MRNSPKGTQAVERPRLSKRRRRVGECSNHKRTDKKLSHHETSRPGTRHGSYNNFISAPQHPRCRGPSTGTPRFPSQLALSLSQRDASAARRLGPLPSIVCAPRCAHTPHATHHATLVPPTTCPNSTTQPHAAYPWPPQGFVDTRPCGGLPLRLAHIRASAKCAPGARRSHGRAHASASMP